MSSFIIEGGHRLSGEIKPQGAKNEALQVICAVLLTDEEVVIENIPEILDVRNLIELLQSIGVGVARLAKGKYSFKADSIDREYIGSKDFVARCARLRGSVMIAGPLLARMGHVYFPKPGGDKIGRRRVDTHILGSGQGTKGEIYAPRRGLRHRHGQYPYGSDAGQGEDGHI